MKRAIILGILCSLSLAFAQIMGTATVDEEAIYPGESFEATVVVTNVGIPTDAVVVVRVLDHEDAYIIPRLATGETYRKSIQLTAPRDTGTYAISVDINDGEDTAKHSFEVVESPLKVSNVRLEPGHISAGEETNFVFSIENTGDFILYDVKASVEIDDSLDYTIEESSLELFREMQPYEQITRVLKIRADNDAAGSDEINLKIIFTDFAGSHTLTEKAVLTVGAFPMMEILIFVLVILVVVYFLFKRLA
jgi:hypothetical protein